MRTRRKEIEFGKDIPTSGTWTRWGRVNKKGHSYWSGKIGNAQSTHDWSRLPAAGCPRTGYPGGGAWVPGTANHDQNWTNLGKQVAKNVANYTCKSLQRKEKSKTTLLCFFQVRCFCTCIGVSHSRGNCTTWQPSIKASVGSHVPLGYNFHIISGYFNINNCGDIKVPEESTLSQPQIPGDFRLDKELKVWRSSRDANSTGNSRSHISIFETP